MIEFQLSPENQDQNSDVRKIMQNAMNNILILDAAPTASSNSVPEGQIGYFLGKMYATIEGVLKEWSVSNTA